MITKNRFRRVCDKYPPNAYIRGIYFVFSSDPGAVGAEVQKFIMYVLIFFFSGGLLFTILVDKHKRIIEVCILLYGAVLFCIFLLVLPGVMMNNYRLKKIRKELGISKTEYNALLKKSNLSL